MRFLTFPNPSRERAAFRALTTWGLLAMSFLLSTSLADKTAADYFVHSLPGAPDGPLTKMHAGSIPKIMCFSEFS
jgi:carboxypeptidase D